MVGVRPRNASRDVGRRGTLQRERASASRLGRHRKQSQRGSWQGGRRVAQDSEQSASSSRSLWPGPVPARSVLTCRWFFGLRRCCRGNVYPMRPLENETGYFTPRRCMDASGASASSCSSMLIENDGEKLAACRQNVDRETHHWTLIATVFTLRPARSSPSHWQPSPTSPRRCLSCVAMKVRLKVARRYTHTMHLSRDAEQGGM